MVQHLPATGIMQLNRHTQIYKQVDSEIKTYSNSSGLCAAAPACIEVALISGTQGGTIAQAT
jgi:hypothetical protein